MKTPAIGLLLILMMKKEGEATTTTTTATTTADATIMESNYATIICHTQPSTLLGKYERATIK